MRTLLVPTLVSLALSPAALAQVTSRVTPGPLKDAGIYHVQTGTWTRTGVSSAISPDAIYRNDYPAGYFAVGFEGCWAMDEIMLPGPTNPYHGAQDAYRVDGLTFSYCKLGTGTVDWTFGYFDGYVPCDDPTAPTNCITESPVVHVIPGLPGGSACWTLTLDFSGGYEVCLGADGGTCAPGYQGGGLGLDHGAIGFGFVTSDGGLCGPSFGGDPRWGVGGGTCYQPQISCAGATGLGAKDMFSLSDHNGFTGCSVGNGCYFFGGYKAATSCGPPTGHPLVQFNITLYADCSTVCAPASCAAVFCDESVDPSNTSDISIDTCSASAASIPVRLAGAPPHQFGYLLVGDGNQAVVDPPGADGTLCLTGGTCYGGYELDVQSTGATGTAFTDLKAAASAPCNGGVAIVPGATWNFQYWHRGAPGLPSRFSSAVTVSFE